MYCVKNVLIFVFLIHQYEATEQAANIPPAIFPTDNSTYTIIQNNSTLKTELPPAIFPTDNSTFKIIPKETIESELPPAIFPTDNRTYVIIPKNDSLLETDLNITVPFEFPKNSSQYRLYDNSTILKVLIANAKNSTHKTSEVEDLSLQTNHLLVNKTSTKNILHNEVTEKPKKVDNALNTDVELIEPDEMNVNIAKNVTHLKAVNSEYNIKDAGVSILQEQWPAFLAGLFVLLAISGYIGLLTWRRYLEHRYGAREMLVNEEDYNSTSDFRNFEL